MKGDFYAILGWNDSVCELFSKNANKNGVFETKGLKQKCYLCTHEKRWRIRNILF